MSGRVAVIAVHGVADQLPFATARGVADLLKCHLIDEVPAFSEEQLRIEVHPVRIPPPPPPATPPPASAQLKTPGAETTKAGKKPAPTTSPLTQWKAGVDLACDTFVPPGKAVAAPGEADVASGETDAENRSAIQSRTSTVGKKPVDPHEQDRQDILAASRRGSDEYFAKQLSEYRQESADTIYETVCLSSTIRDKPVDIYEMYWADLSRVQNVFLQAVEELYYVLFAVCNIGRMELDRSRALFDKWPWKWLRMCEGFAERVLILFVPLGNACLLLLLVFTLPHLLPDRFTAEAPQFFECVGLGVGLVVGAIVFGCWWRHRPALAICFLLSGGLVGFGIGYVISFRPPEQIRIVLSLLLWSVSFVVLFVLSGRLNIRQPGARRVGLILGVLVFFPVIVEAFRRSGEKKFWALDIGLATAEWVLFGLMLLWLAYLAAAVACSVLGKIAVHRERKSSPRRTTAARIVWTANLAILAPGILMIVLNLGIWQALSTVKGYLIPKLLPAALSHVPAGPYAAWLQDLVEFEQRAQSPPSTVAKAPGPPGPCCGTQLNEEWSGLKDKFSKLPQKFFQLFGAKAAATPGEVAQGPPPFSIEANRVPDLLIRNSARPMFVALGALVLMLLSAGWLLLPAILSEGTTASEPEYARQLGNSLSSAWRWLRPGAELFVRGQLLAVIVVCVGIAYPGAFWKCTGVNLKELSLELSVPALWAVGWLFAALASGAIRFAGLRTVVDVAADVANWLRMYPKENNPTSRISARYVSLLRCIALRKDKDDADKPYYDRVVIFAHSLGSAITVDLLQFLKKHPDPNRFGYLANETPRSLPPIYLFTHGCPLRQLLGLRLPITYGWAWHGSKGWDDNEEPKGQELLSVVKWVNAYCSGDYVGRHLWYNDVSDEPWDSKPRRKWGTVPRVELCVGAGAHVHYWDPEPKATGTGTTASSGPSKKMANELLKLMGVPLPL
ncbi:MAG: hypothetical protein AABP62_14395 [Planctomycetota bacterium]